jgi:hypothetical protein
LRIAVQAVNLKWTVVASSSIERGTIPLNGKVPQRSINDEEEHDERY